MNFRAFSIFLALCLPAAAVLSAQAPQQSASQTSAPQAPATQDANVVIGPDDGITIVALESDELSKLWRVSGSGDLSLPLVGKIHAAGLTAQQLQDQLAENLKRYIKDPQVTVYVTERRSRPVTVTGGVHKPGTYQIDGHETVLGAVTMAAGFDYPGPSVILTRPIESGPIPLPAAHSDFDGKHSSIELRVSDISNPSTASANLEVLPNDVISVSTQKRLVFIIGEVNKPGAVELVTQDSVSVIQALAAAGGMTKTAAGAHTEIMRANDQGLYSKVTSIDLKRLLTGKTEDRLLHSGDVIFVPSSSIKLYGQATSLAAISTGLLVLTRF